MRIIQQDMIYDNLFFIAFYMLLTDKLLYKFPIYMFLLPLQ